MITTKDQVIAKDGNVVTEIKTWKLYFLSFWAIGLIEGNLYRIILNVQHSDGLAFNGKKFYPFFEMLNTSSFCYITIIIVMFIFVLFGNMTWFKKTLHIVFIAFLNFVIAICLEVSVNPGIGI